jgi:hypothetical protein
MKNKLMLLLVLPMLVMVSSCDSISDRLRKKAEGYPTKLTNTQKKITENEKKYNSYLKSVPNKVASYSKSENLPSNFTKAKENLKLGDKIYKNSVMVLLENDESKSEGRLTKQLTTIDGIMKKSITTSEYPYERLSLINDVFKNSNKYKLNSDRHKENTIKKAEDLRSFAKPYLVKYPKQKKTINNLVAQGDGMVQKVSLYNDIVTNQITKLNAKDSVNLTSLVDSYQNGGKVSLNMNKHNKDTKKKLKELDQSYSKILKDMKARFYVQVGRSSWDSSSDYGGKDYLYPMVEVDEETFKYFEGLASTVTLASELGYGTSDVNVKIKKSMWDKLKIRPKANYPSSHDDSEFWLNNTVTKYYHNYIIENNGKVINQSSWKEVSEDVFLENLDNLGMTIYSKPLGSFEKEAISEAAPAGLTYVNNPKYGQWKKDSNGNEFWVFYGQYMFLSHLMGGHNYSRYEYNDYNRNYRNKRRSYYGSGGARHYGTRGARYTKTKSYASSNYKRSYASSPRSSYGHSGISKTSRSRSQTSSSRSGSSRRGGGPGGGGK